MTVLVSALTVVAKQQLSARALLVLAWLAQNNGNALTMVQLGKVCACTSAAMTGIIDVLERARFVERVYDSQDRRAIIIQLTNTGLAVITELAQQVEPQPEGLAA